MVTFRNPDSPKLRMVSWNPNYLCVSEVIGHPLLIIWEYDGWCLGSRKNHGWSQWKSVERSTTEIPGGGQLAAWGSWETRSFRWKKSWDLDKKQGGGFKHFLFSPLWKGKWSNLTSIFFKGLKSPTREIIDPKNHWTLLWRGLDVFIQGVGISSPHQFWDPIILWGHKFKHHHHCFFEISRCFYKFGSTQIIWSFNGGYKFKHVFFWVLDKQKFTKTSW